MHRIAGIRVWAGTIGVVLLGSTNEGLLGDGEWEWGQRPSSERLCTEREEEWTLQAVETTED